MNDVVLIMQSIANSDEYGPPQEKKVSPLNSSLLNFNYYIDWNSGEMNKGFTDGTAENTLTLDAQDMSRSKHR